MYSIEDCLEISNRVGIPVVFDTHHHSCFKKIYPTIKMQETKYYIPLILETWNKKNIKPKFHVSEQGSGRIGHHSDYIQIIPTYLLEIPSKYNTHIDIMIEAKQKEKSIFKLYGKYPSLNCKCCNENIYIIKIKKKSKMNSKKIE
jgi:UV DNA damage endonuclease